MGLTNATQYYFTVRARNGVGTGAESAPSNTVTPAGRPFAPVDVSAAPGVRSATVTWEPPPARADGVPGDNGDPITSYVITAQPGGTTTTVSGGSLEATVGELTESRQSIKPVFRLPARTGPDAKVRRCQGQRPRQDSNLRTRLRRPALYPLSYEGGELRDGPPV